MQSCSMQHEKNTFLPTIDHFQPHGIELEGSALTPRQSYFTYKNYSPVNTQY